MDCRSRWRRQEWLELRLAGVESSLGGLAPSSSLCVGCYSGDGAGADSALVSASQASTPMRPHLWIPKIVMIGTLFCRSLLVCVLLGVGARGGEPLDFSHDIAPLLSRFGCNGSACHGNAEGQNGFRLSVFGNDPVADYEALVVQGRGRRVMPAAPDESLMLRKSAGTVPHAGGRRMTEGSREYGMLRDWIAGGAVYLDSSKPELKSVRIDPPDSVHRFGEHRSLGVRAMYSDGVERDVTWLAVFHSNDASIAEVDDTGRMSTGHSVGQAALMARFSGQIAVHRVTVPRPGERVEFGDGDGATEIDRMVNANLRRMNLKPSEPADDAVFLRRVFLDLAGRLPSLEEAKAFLDDGRADKRAVLVDGLLERPEWADVWALKWSDLLRVDRRTLGHRAAYAYYGWIHRSMKENVPLDRFARGLLEAEGPLQENPAGYFFRVAKKSGEVAATTSQALMGIRITCAECHQHPFDRWTQSDYHGMRAYFEQVQYKKVGDEEALVVEGNPKVLHPRTKEALRAHPLGEAMPESDPEGDRRRALSGWLTAPENPWFARNLANRIWAHFLGRGLVEPVDDVRATNPPTNPELLDRLAAMLVADGFNPKPLMRRIVLSQTYGRSATPNETNGRDERNFSRALFRRLPSEVLMDAICDVTGVPEKYAGVPYGMRAVQLWDSEQQSYFLKLFGRPQRTTPCECERSVSASVSQALHFMNSPNLQSKLAHARGNVTRWVAEGVDDGRLAESLYLACYSRRPSASEVAEVSGYLRAAKGTRQQAAEDLAWSLMNTLEFVFNH